jgi:hypothetical protein
MAHFTVTILTNPESKYGSPAKALKAGFRSMQTSIQKYYNDKTESTINLHLFILMSSYGK